MHPKLAASAAGGGAGGAIAIIFLWILSLHGVTVPENVAMAFDTLFSCVLGIFSGYVTPSGGAPPNPAPSKLVGP